MIEMKSAENILDVDEKYLRSPHAIGLNASRDWIWPQSFALGIRSDISQFSDPACCKKYSSIINTIASF